MGERGGGRVLSESASVGCIAYKSVDFIKANATRKKGYANIIHFLGFIYDCTFLESKQGLRFSCKSTANMLLKAQLLFFQICVTTVVVVVIVVVVVDPKLLSSLLLYSLCQADESACLLQLV